MNERFVFGYGSLVGENLHCPVARLDGWRRVWGVAMDNRIDAPGYRTYRLRADGSRPAVFVAYLDIAPDPACSVTGVCMPVGDGELAVLDHRERNYDRIDVTRAIGAPDGRVWTYRGSASGRARLRRGLAGGRAVVSRAYVDAAVAGIGAIAAPAEVADLERSLGDIGLTILDLYPIELPPAGR